MRCDKCQNEFESEQLMKQDELVTSRNVELYPELDLGELIKFYKSLKVSAFLCETCFLTDYKRFAVRRFITIFILIIIVDFILAALVAFGNWGSPSEQFWAGVIFFSIANSFLIIAPIFYFLVFKRIIKPLQIEHLTVFAPYLYNKLKTAKEEFEVDANKLTAVERILEIYEKNPKCFVLSYGGEEVKELRQIGQKLFDEGGMELMRWVHEHFRGRCNILGGPRNLEQIWDGIGNWKG